MKKIIFPDRDTPDWMQADIRRGMMWMYNRLLNLKQ